MQKLYINQPNHWQPKSPRRSQSYVVTMATGAENVSTLLPAYSVSTFSERLHRCVLAILQSHLVVFLIFVYSTEKGFIPKNTSQPCVKCVQRTILIAQSDSMIRCVKAQHKIRVLFWDTIHHHDNQDYT